MELINPKNIYQKVRRLSYMLPGEIGVPLMSENQQHFKRKTLWPFTKHGTVESACIISRTLLINPWCVNLFKQKIYI